MSDCGDIREAIASGGDLGVPEIQAHLDRCAPCRDLAADDGRLARTLTAAEEAPSGPTAAPPAPRSTSEAVADGGGPPDLEAMMRQAEQAVARDRGPVAFLRSRPTPVRFALAFGAAFVVLAFYLLSRPRPDLAAYPMARLVLTGAALLATTVAVLYLALRPTYRPPPSPALVAVLIGTALALPFAIASLPMPPVQVPENLLGASGDLVPKALGCFGTGLLATLPLFLLWRGLDRSPRRSRPLLLAAGAAGLVANLLLEVHCVIDQPLHLLAGHASVALAYFAGATLWLVLRPQR